MHCKENGWKLYICIKEETSMILDQNKKSTKDNEKIVSLTLKCSKHGKAPILPISEMTLGFRHDDVSKTYESTYIYIISLQTSIISLYNIV